MTTTSDARIHRLAHHLGRHPYTVIAAVTLLVMGLAATLKHESAWDRVSFGGAQLLLQGRDFYEEIHSYTYPPFTAWVSIPFTLLPLRAARAAWYVLSAASLVYLCVKAWRVSGGPRIEPLDLSNDAQRREQIALIIGIACAIQFALNALTHLQSDLLIGALLMAGCGAMVRGRYLRAATWIGLAAAFKATPLLFAPYLFWRRRWLAGAWVIVVAVGANLLPDTIHQPPTGGWWVTRWTKQYLEPMTHSDYLPGDWQNDLDNNQSIAGAANRWLATRWQKSQRGLRITSRPNRPSTAAIRGVFLGGCALVILPVAWIEWRRRKVTRGRTGGETFKDVRRDEPQRPLPSTQAIECGMVLLLMLLLSPNSSRAHFCIMILPAFCAARFALWLPSRTVGALLAVAVLASTLSIHLRLPGTQDSEQILLWLGVVTWAAVFLLLALVAALHRIPPHLESEREVQGLQKG